MDTRSSPSREKLIRLGKEAGLSTEQMSLPKQELYKLLNGSYNIDRLERRLLRNSSESVSESYQSLLLQTGPGEDVPEQVSVVTDDNKSFNDSGSLRRSRRLLRKRSRQSDDENVKIGINKRSTRQRQGTSSSSLPYSSLPSSSSSSGNVNDNKSTRRSTKGKGKGKINPSSSGSKNENKSTRRSPKGKNKASVNSSSSGHINETKSTTRSTKGKSKAKVNSSSLGNKNESKSTRRSTKAKNTAFKVEKKNEIFSDGMDPITREPLGKHVFTFKRPYGKEAQFDAGTLVDYILASGDFLEPESRIPFSPNDMKRLDNLVRKAGLNKGSVYEAIRDKERYTERKVSQDALLALERCIGEVVSEMLSIIDAVCDLTADPETAETQLLLNVFPVFAHYFTLLRGMDSEYATKCVKQYISFIVGPPNRPTRNRLGFRDSVLHFLHQMTF
uniref:Uncharacterized protein n=2 Tax=Sar TaxID=2698737 RepID=A0A7S3PKL8_9STRA|mmetsp:Transcript_4361/g.5505  ORF Transcript_4361/g.5505 Transcript_4361/m.5505 type:complete len:445 (-) Transcript_4361:1228-2562(-)|eukprot:CAMPEP_0204850186 /NCGR_PEP_ID=MMETSP1347-20130617/7682_1 /ASSEMBLY_ACC=CAM_ASM_000690 /TAXON_ID=215587 /ORGANISM="Aplanochytrium stocchinoi, Strain GSBS06" /LENGTH=444 /DNA_ID=CAMNT_0051993019 /DNA_START=202 /DNA_END=1536 /DNA_ORIENTATION=+